ncbi:MAG: glycosyl hydrolase family 18 protein [Paludibacter sp.]|nr:glycosyl hydrolase family 18 protein [Paludibacter sp.]
MKKVFFILTLVLTANQWIVAQVDNYSLKLTASGFIEAGCVNEINSLESYTIQAWINPSIWTPGAAIFTRGNNDSRFDLCLGNQSGEIVLHAGTQFASVSSSGLAAGKWAQITIIYHQNNIKAYVNNILVLNTTAQLSIPISYEKFVLGSNFSGRIDEFRVWSGVLSSDYFLWRNTVNKYHPQWDNLIVYYKFDQNLCPNIVDYTFKHHGIFSGTGAVREKVTDNTAFKYRIHSAYTDFSRFADRGVEKEKYLLSNDIIMLGVESKSDGTITIPFPYNEGTVTNGNYLSSYNGRNGVLSLNGTGAKMSVGNKALIPDTKYSFHTWIYLETWTEGAFIFKKEASDSQGFSIRLGDATTNELIVRLNGQEFKRPVPTARVSNPVGSWWHLGIVAFSLDMGATKTFMFTFNGFGYFPNSSGAPATSPSTLLPLGVENTAAVIGENLNAKLDETVIWHTDLTEAQITSYMNALPMPGFGKVVTAQTVFYKMNSFWNYDNPDNIGYDLYSYKHFMGIIRSAFDGYRGHTVRMSVRGHDNWQSTVASDAKRKTMAAGIVAAAAEFDGIDLDFEWCYDGTCFNNYGLLIEEIGKIMPQEKIFTVSPHYVSYALNPKYMQYVDYFNFQIYGPSANMFKWSTYLDAYNKFIAQGYPKEKIILSFATTTSKGYEDAAGTIQTTAAPIGVRTGLLDGSYTPDMNVVLDSNGRYRFITGVNQTRDRSDFIHDYDLAGIMYWDLGNDVLTSHPYSLPKTSNFALASNVDTIITQVDMEPNAVTHMLFHKPETMVVFPNPANDYIQLKISEEENIDAIRIYTATGQLIDTKQQVNLFQKINVSHLPKGFYCIRLHTQSGKVYSSGFIKL